MKCLITEEGRECSQCGKFKIWDQFHKSRTTKLGHASICIFCCLQYKRTGLYQREKVENKIIGQLHSAKKPEKIVDKMKTNHPVIEVKNYWDDSDMIEIGTKPISALYNHIK